jgi:hypothetical protein
MAPLARTRDAAHPVTGPDADPVSEKPDIPKSYGISADPADLLPWRWPDERLQNAKDFWVVTVRPDGRPHAVPVWGAWVDRRFFWDGGGRKAKNLETNPHANVHIEAGGGAVVIMEGIYDRDATPDDAQFERIRASYGARYDYRPETPGQLYVIRPRTILAWTNFAKDATRWRIDTPRT